MKITTRALIYVMLLSSIVQATDWDLYDAQQAQKQIPYLMLMQMAQEQKNADRTAEQRQRELELREKEIELREMENRIYEEKQRQEAERNKSYLQKVKEYFR